MGDAQRKQNHFREAINYYSQCLVHHVSNNYALFGLADCYKALNQYPKAIEIWEQYLIHDNKNITVLTRVADAYRKIRNFKQSKQVYLKVLDMEENNAYALIGLGHLHYDFKEYKDALYSWGTDYAHLEAATNAINADNVVEVFDEFYNKYGIGEGETLIDAIYNDFDDWTNSWYGITGAAPTFKALHDTLVQRAQNHIENYGDNDGKLQKAIDDFNTAFNSINDDNYDDKHQALKTMFSNMIQAIKTAEAETLKAEKNLVEQSKQEK